WTANWGLDYATAWAQWIFDIDNNWPDGVYNVEVVFGGNTYETIFGVNTNLGVEDLKATDISIYPNPASNALFVKANSVIEKVELFDLLGRKVSEISPDAENTEINISSLKTGMYIAIISSEGK